MTSEKASRREYVLSGRNAEVQMRYALKNPEARQRAVKRFNHSARHRAHSLARKYGITLIQMERMGIIPPDVQEALAHGNH